MGSVASIHVKAENQSAILKLIQQLSDANEMTYENYPTEADNYIVGDGKKPTIVAVSEVKNGWINIFSNYFGKMENWLEALSRESGAMAIQVLWQTVSDVYYFTIYDKGKLRRRIEVYYGDLDSVVDLGEKFIFEKEFLVLQNDEDYENIFGRDDIEEYCRNLGIELFAKNGQAKFYIFRRKKIGLTLSRWLEKKVTQKPWWQFW